MTDYRDSLSKLRRPKLLISAARHGVAEYRRDRDLRRIAGLAGSVAPDRVLPHLLSEEDRIEQTRKAGEASYDIARHVEILIALMAEVRLLPRPPQAAR